MYSINAFNVYDSSIQIRVALPESEMETWKQLCSEYKFTVEHTLFPGGETRFHSVKNGLQNIPKQSLVAIHDGVRPLVSTKTIANCFKTAEEFGTAIPVISIDESIRKVQENDSVAEDRSAFKLVQTPQVFQSDILLDAYNTEYRQNFTDDATVVESAGFKIYITEGNEENIKITTAKDLIIAEALLVNN